LEKTEEIGNSAKVELNQEGYLPILEGIGESLKLLFQEPSTGEWRGKRKQIAQIEIIFLRIGTIFLYLGEYSKAEKYLIEANSQKAKINLKIVKKKLQEKKK